MSKKKQKEYHVRIIGHILDRDIMDKIGGLLEEFDSDVKNVRISYTSSFGFRGEGGPSCVDFYVEGPLEEMEQVIKKIKRIAENENCIVPFVIDRNMEVRYLFRIEGHIMDRDLMDRFSKRLEDLNVDIDTILIMYPSVRDYMREARPSFVEFYVTGEEKQVSIAIARIVNTAVENGSVIRGIEPLEPFEL
jgi:hypothetical protein